MRAENGPLLRIWNNGMMDGWNGGLEWISIYQIQFMGS